MYIYTRVCIYRTMAAGLFFPRPFHLYTYCIYLRHADRPGDPFGTPETPKFDILLRTSTYTRGVYNVYIIDPTHDTYRFRERKRWNNGTHIIYDMHAGQHAARSRLYYYSAYSMTLLYTTIIVYSIRKNTV